MIQAVIFDLDGTLADSFEDIALAANDALRQLGRVALPIDHIKTQVGHGLRNLMIGLLENADDEEVDRSIDYVMEFYEKHPTVHTQLYPGALPMLDRLTEKGIRTGVLSNKVDSLVQRIAENLGLVPRMDEIWGQRKGYPLKPDPKSLKEILKGLNLEASNCLVVGDATPDRQLAERAGTHFCGVSYGMTPRSHWEDEGVKWIIDSLDELPDTLNLVGRATRQD